MKLVNLSSAKDDVFGARGTPRRGRRPRSGCFRLSDFTRFVVAVQTFLQERQTRLPWLNLWRSEKARSRRVIRSFLCCQLLCILVHIHLISDLFLLSIELGIMRKQSVTALSATLLVSIRIVSLPAPLTHTQIQPGAFTRAVVQIKFLHDAFTCESWTA